jgi:hypothetical protein
VHRAPGIPHALCFQGGDFLQTSDASRREIEESHLELQRHCEKQSDEATQHCHSGAMRSTTESESRSSASPLKVYLE